MATPNNVERGWLALVFTCQNSFNFLRVVMVTAAFVCSMFAISYHVLVQEAKEAQKKAKISENLAEIGIAICIMFLPLIMLGRHLFTCYSVHKLPREKARNYRIGMRIITMLVTALTMLESATTTAIEVRKKDELKMVALVMSSMILSEGALLVEDNYGVFELILTVFIVQFINTFAKLKQVYLYVIILLVYVGRGGVMYSMKKKKEKVGRQGKNGPEELEESWDRTNEQLRDHHRINVDRDLPRFVSMKAIIQAMRENDDTAI